MTATLLTPTALKKHVETDLPSDALQQILDSEEMEIVRRVRSLTTVSHRLAGYSKQITLPSAAASVSSVLEDNGAETLTLATNDYTLWPSGMILERRYDGDNPGGAFGRWVTVTYVPVNQNARLIMALVDLCKLRIQFNGVSAERVGDYSSSTDDYAKMREGILRSITPGGGWSVA